MAIDSLQIQIASAMQRFASLQRRIDGEGQPPKLLSRVVEELEKALEEVQVAQDQLIENRFRLEQVQIELSRERERYWRLFNDMPQPYVVTRPDSAILEVNKAASDLLNVSQRFLVGKTLSVFVCQDRTGFLNEITRVTQEADPVELMLRIRPRERAPLDVMATVSGDGTSLRWVLQPAQAGSAATSSLV